MDPKIISEIQSNLSLLRIRAGKVGFVDKLPTIPVFRKEAPFAHESQLRGFNNRLSNWEKCLAKLEFVNQKPVKSTTETIELPEGVKLIREVE